MPTRADWKSPLRRIPGLVQGVRICRILIDPRYRSEWLLRYRRPDNLFQPSGHTWANRYSVFFSFVHERLKDLPQPRLLSFGCSSGEEVFQLRTRFPGAEIVGVDINSRSIALARRRLGKCSDPNIHFEVASSARGLPESHFDAIFCMAVFRHGDLEISRPDSCADWIRFADFEQTLEGLAHCLKPGGYLVIRHSHFRFEDAGVSSNFEPVYRHSNRRGESLLYGCDNHRLPGETEQAVVFRKHKKGGTFI